MVTGTQPTTVIQKVVTDFEMKGDFRKEVDRSSKSVKRLNSGFSKLGRTVGRVIAAYAGFSAIRGIIRETAQFEKTILSLASTEKQIGKLTGETVSMADAMDTATSAITLLQDAARKSPATATQVTEAFGAIKLAATTSGLSLKETVDFARDIATRAAGSDNPSLILNDITKALNSGKVDIDAGALRPYLGAIRAAVKGGDQRELIDVFRDAVKVDADELEAIGNSFGGQLSSLQTEFSALMREVGTPLLAELNVQMKDLLKWVTENKEEISKMARGFGEFLGDAVSLLPVVLKHLDKIVIGFGVLTGAKMIAGFAALTGSVGKLGATLNPILIALAAAPFIADAAGAAATRLFGYTTESDRINADRKDGIKMRTELRTMLRENPDDPLLRETAIKHGIKLASVNAAGAGRKLGKPSSVNIDARHSRFTINQKFSESASAAQAAIVGSMETVIGKRVQATLGLGSVPLVGTR